MLEAVGVGGPGGVGVEALEGPPVAGGDGLEGPGELPAMGVEAGRPGPGPIDRGDGGVHPEGPGPGLEAHDVVALARARPRGLVGLAAEVVPAAREVGHRGVEEDAGVVEEEEVPVATGELGDQAPGPGAALEGEGDHPIVAGHREAPEPRPLELRPAPGLERRRRPGRPAVDQVEAAEIGLGAKQEPVGLPRHPHPEHQRPGRRRVDCLDGPADQGRQLPDHGGDLGAGEAHARPGQLR